MRKVFWCCLAAGAAVCCAFWVVAYVSQNPDSALGRFALAAASHVGGSAASGARADQIADADELIPPDPIPVEELPDTAVPPALTPPDERLPPAVAALIPPIVIHDEEDLNASAGPDAKTAPPAPAAVDVETTRPSTVDSGAVAHRLDDVPPVEPTAGPPMMPYCTDDARPAPIMPRCLDEDDAPAMPPPGDETGCGARPPSDAWAAWLGFLCGPSQLNQGPAVGRCEEDAHYTQQYPGAPYTGPSRDPEPPAHAGLNPPSFPDVEQPAPKDKKAVDPLELFSHPQHSEMPRPVEPKSDTMEMRPTDWKPYSLDPGPF